MAIGNYGELKTAVETWLRRSDLDAMIPEFIEGGLQRINNELIARGGNPDQEQVAYASTVASQESLAVPTDYAMLRWIKIDDSASSPVDPLELMDYDTMLEQYGVTEGVPETFCVQDESFYVRPIPDAAYTVRIGYIKRYASFADDVDTKYLLTAGGNILLYASLLEAEGASDNDQAIGKWMASWGNRHGDPHRTDRSANRTSSGLGISRPGVGPFVQGN